MSKHSTEHALYEKELTVLLQLNARLEKEVSRLCEELDEATQGVLKRGYLYKFRDIELSYASKWSLRYFVLKGTNLSYYVDERDNRPRKTIDLSNCLVRPEGIKRGIYHLFSIYLITPDRPEQDGSRLLRLSCESSAEAKQWMTMLEQGCNLGEINSDTTEVDIPTLNLPTLIENDETVDKDEWGNTVDTDAIEDEGLNNVSSRILTRVKSASKILKKSSSRQYIVSPSNIPRSPSHQNFKPRTPFPASKIVHLRNISSPLSTDAKPGEQSNYRGFFNLGVIILVLSNFRMITDNLMKYGFLMKFPWNTSSQQCLSETCPDGTWSSPKSFQAIVSWAISILISFIVEKIAASDGFPEKTILIVNTIICTLNIILPCIWVLYYSKSHPGSCMIYLFQSVIIWMKLISYHHCNRDLRKTLRATRTKQSVSQDSLDSQAKPASLENIFAETNDLEPPYLYYPMNIALPNLLYFCLAPTLCYQLNYPRSPHIRWKYLLTLIIRMFLVGGLLIFVVEQYIKPTLEGSIDAIDMLKNKMDISLVMVKLLKLSIPNTYCWLLMFYFYFHLFLNFLAEITRFGDRLFYKDWWNSRTIENYWRSWNVPVHNWMLRHLYHPLIRAGAPKMVGTIVVFFFSAVFHEYIISTPFRMYTMHVFLGMMLQAPLIFITSKIDKILDNSFVGNAIFWSSFCVVGQPVGIILVYTALSKVSSS